MKQLDILIERWNSKTPKFWKLLQRLSLALGTLGITISASPDLFWPWLVDASSHFMSIGAIGTVMTQLTKADPPTSDSENIEENLP